MRNIGIVGSGVAGMHLAHLLLQKGVDVTVYSDRSAEQIRASKFFNTPARFYHTLDRERALGIFHWDDVEPLTHANLSITGTPLQFTAYLSKPSLFQDPRVSTSVWLDDFEARGGKVVVGALTADDVTRLSENHGLMVVASGRGSLIEMFERIPEYSPFEVPQRNLVTGFFNGILKNDPNDMEFIIVPEQGEIFVASAHTFGGTRHSLLIEGIPGGAFDTLTNLRYQDDPALFNQRTLELLQTYAPTVRLDPETFGVADDNLMQGAVKPAVRKAYKDLGNGKFAMAVGDVHVTNDPIVGQGANTASQSAWTLGQMILADNVYDAAFCKDAEAEMWAYTGPVTQWANAFLLPPPDHALALLGAAAQNQALADAFMDNFNEPVTQWEILSSPENTMAFIRQFTPEMQPA
jgi:hypothetical protein